MSDESNASAASSTGASEMKKENNPFLKHFDEVAARVKKDVLESDDPKVIPVRVEIAPGFSEIVLRRSGDLKPKP